jgi:glycosyltransferase involved in cell wall biosynthesis
LVVQKRFDRFLSILRTVGAQTDKKIRATIAGEGPERATLERKAADLGLVPDVVEFRGAIPDMVPLYRDSDIFVLTSDWEGTPNVLLEAMASGLPVIASRVGGVPDIVRHGRAGYLTEPGDENSCASLLLQLIDDPQLRMEMGRQGRQYIEANHGVARLGGYLESLYKEWLS